MNIKKYRVYLMMLVIIAVIFGAVSFFYFTEKESSYTDGMLVQTEWQTEGEDAA